jgi:hypothetical protein
MKSYELDMVDKEMFDRCYNKFETRSIGKYSCEIMPPLAFLPKNIHLKYDKDEDKITLTIQDENGLNVSKIALDNISITKDKDNLIHKIEYFNVLKEDQRKKRQKIDSCIKDFLEDKSNSVLFYDLNLRALELFKIILLRFTKDYLKRRRFRMLKSKNR